MFGISISDGLRVTVQLLMSSDLVMYSVLYAHSAFTVMYSKGMRKQMRINVYPMFYPWGKPFTKPIAEAGHFTTKQSMF